MRSMSITHLLDRSVAGRRAFYLAIGYYIAMILFVAAIIGAGEGATASSTSQLHSQLSLFEHELSQIPETVLAEAHPGTTLSSLLFVPLHVFLTVMAVVASAIAWVVGYLVFYASAIVPQRVLILFFELGAYLLVAAAIGHLGWALKYHIEKMHREIVS